MISKILKTKNLIFAVILLIPAIVNAQMDTLKYPIIDFTIETGVFFPRSDDFQNVYNSKSTFNWSIGTKFGTSHWKVLPWVKYSQYQSKIDSLISNDVDNDGSIYAKRNQISIGLVNPIKIRNNDFIQFKCGLSYNFITEELTDLQSKPLGLIMSIGYMKQLSRRYAYYVDLNYDYANTNSGLYFKDWSGFLLNFGISFNIGAE